jgi:catechol 2,3-dioxygenase-like lactoylglutathione lyase family enzyme
MKQSIGCVTFLVREYDEAVSFFAGKLRFRVVEDSAMGEGRRWVVLSPRGAGESRLQLAKAKNPEEFAAIGRQGGGRVFLFLYTDDFARDHEDMRKRGVKFIGEPRNETYGTVAVFEDLYGNKWDLLMPAKPGV